MIRSSYPITMLACALALTAAHTAGADDATDQPAGAPQNVLNLPPAEGNPRNSEVGFVQLKDGRVMMIYTRFTGGGGDHDRASLMARYSSDQGQTWTDKPVEVVSGDEGGMNVMSVSLLRLQDGRIAMFYLRKNSGTDCRPLLRFSSDEGKTWSEPTVCIPDDEVGYYVLNNDRVIQLTDGRLVAPVSRHNEPQGKWSHNGHIMCYLSDDQGKSWRRSKGIVSTHDEAQAKDRIHLQEPGVVQLKDGRVMMYMRSNARCQMLSYSDDGGETWTKPVRSKYVSADYAPAIIERIPKTGDLLLVWNNHQDVDAARHGMRTPLSIAISRDDGATWERIETIEDNPHGWYCYPAVEFVGDHVLLAYCGGDMRKIPQLAQTQVTRFGLDWLYP